MSGRKRYQQAYFMASMFADSVDEFYDLMAGSANELQKQYEELEQRGRTRGRNANSSSIIARIRNQPGTSSTMAMAPQQTSPIQVDDETKAENATTSNSCAISGKTCVICLEATSDVLLSCGHFKFCLECFELQRANVNKMVAEYRSGLRDVEPVFECPLCRAKITSHMHIKNIYVD